MDILHDYESIYFFLFVRIMSRNVFLDKFPNGLLGHSLTIHGHARLSRVSRVL